MTRKRPLAATLEERLGAPLGATLTGLAALRLTGVRVYLELGPEAWDWGDIVDKLEQKLGIVIVGKTGNGFFGPVRASLKRSASAAPWIYCDRHHLDPERVGTLADLMTLWCFVPDFFTLADRSADELQEDHDEFMAAHRSVKRALAPILRVPGVRTLGSGAAAARLIAKVGGFVTGSATAAVEAPAKDDEPGQSFEVTKQRILEIERKYLAKFRKGN